MKWLYVLACWYVRRYVEREERIAVARQHRLFPVGTRVEITGVCCTLRSPKGTLGTVEGPTSSIDDWWVRTDDGRREIYCAKGMRRVP